MFLLESIKGTVVHSMYVFVTFVGVVGITLLLNSILISIKNLLTQTCVDSLQHFFAKVVEML